MQLRRRAGGEDDLPLQTSHVTIEVVLVSGNGTGIGVLPESVVTPPIRQIPDAASIVCDPQWAVGSKRGAVAGARSPPIGSGIDHGVATNKGMVGVGEVPDLANHRSGAQTITSGTVWVIYPAKKGVQSVDLGGWKYTIHTFDIESTWKGDPVAAPTSAVGGEEVGLSGTGRLVRVSKTVATTNQTGIGSASILGGEVWVRVG